MKVESGEFEFSEPELLFRSKINFVTIIIITGTSCYNKFLACSKPAAVIGTLIDRY